MDAQGAELELKRKLLKESEESRKELHKSLKEASEQSGIVSEEYKRAAEEASEKYKGLNKINESFGHK